MAAANASHAIDVLLTVPDSARDADWLRLLERAGRAAWVVQDALSASRAWDVALEHRTRAMPEDHPDVQAARGNLALAVRKLGDLPRAHALLESVHDVLVRTLPEDHPSLQRARLNLAMTLGDLGDLRAAQQLEERVLETRLRTLPEDHPDLQMARMHLAGTRAQLGDLHGACDLARRVVEVNSRTLPAEHPDFLSARMTLASILAQLGDLPGARELEEQVLAIQLRTLPEEHPALLSTQGNLAITAKQSGDLWYARSLEERILHVRLRTFPEEHPHVQAARLNLAATLAELGDLRTARALEERVLDIRSRTLPEDHPDLLSTRGNLALTLRDLGDLPGARALLERTLEVVSRTLPEEHPDLQSVRSSLALTMRELGDLPTARALQERVLEVDSRTLPEDHPGLARARMNLAVTLADIGDLDAARSLEERVLDVLSRTLPEEHPDLLAARQNLAVSLANLGDFEGARSLLEQVLAVRSRTLPEDHVELQLAMRNLAGLILEQNVRGGWPRPADPALEADRLRCVSLLADQCRYQSLAARRALLEASRREAEARCSELAAGLSLALSLVGGTGPFPPCPELGRPAFLLSEATRGAALGSARILRLAARDARYDELRRGLAACSVDLATQTSRGTTSEEYRQALSRREGLERELVSLGAQFSEGVLPDLETAPEALAGVLGAADAILAYRRYVRVQIGTRLPDGRSATTGVRVPPNTPLHPSSEESLCAFVLRRRTSESAARADGDASASLLAVVDLGSLSTIEDAVRAWRTAIGSGSGRGLATGVSQPADDPTSRGEAVRRLVFDPLMASLDGVQRVILVLDDVLHLVPFDALPLTDAPAMVLGDRFRVETRATTLELLSPAVEWTGTDELLAVGGVDFGSREGGIEGHPLVQGLGGFDPLPGTSTEVALLAEAHAALGNHAPVSILHGVDATRERLIELAPRAGWLHVATHGWFAKESIRSWADPEPMDRLAGLGMRLEGVEQVKGMSPLLLCGLALAGANLSEGIGSRAPGLITADEMATLDLSNCALAVLSACDTNVGERRAGQGVASLQMALQMAGARSVITSLWKVSDEATCELMTDFYRRVWVEKRPKWQALMEAKRAMREAKDGSGNPRHQLRDWAAWVLTGEPH